MMKNGRICIVQLVILLILAACRSGQEIVVTREVPVTVEVPPVVITSPSEVEIVEVTAVPTTPPETPPENKELTICSIEPRNTLYLYGNGGPGAGHLHHAIYTNDFTELSFGYQAEGLEKLPNLADGDAVINKVAVSSGDTVVDANGDVVVLAAGMNLINAAGETVTFAGEPVTMPQMVVDFTMKQRYWSDGTPVTAADSVYSFELAAHPDTPAAKTVILRTVSYEATGELSTRWTGVPGYLSTYFKNFWQPLPQHAWGSYSAADMLELVEVSRRPMGDGAFMVDEWVDGDYIRLIPNPFYYRADEGLPYLDSVIYKIITDDNQKLARLIAGECDIATRSFLATVQTPFLLEAEANGLLVVNTEIGTVFEHIDFGINSYGDYGDGVGRPDWFQDVRVRQAITMCTDRQRMVDEIHFGRSQIPHSYIPSNHPLYAQDVTQWPYDVVQANAQLDEVGYVDSDGDGWREDPATGLPFRVILDTSRANFRLQTTEIFKENMVACGIDVELRYRPHAEFLVDGPEGVVFGRQFDLAEFAWLTGVDPSCNLFTSDAITGPPEEGFGGWGNSNNTGWHNEAYDAACQRAKSSLPGTAEYEAHHKEAQRIFAQELPIIPLYVGVKMNAARPYVLNFGIDPTQNSELYNIYQFDLQR